MKQNQLTVAEQNYSAAAKIAPDDIRVHIALGNLYTAQHNADAARQEFMQAVTLDPKSAQAHGGLGTFYLSQGQFGMAEEQLLAAVALDPGNPDTRVELAKVYEQIGKLEPAERELRTAIGLAPKDGMPHFALANLLDRQSGRSAEADVEYGRAQALDPRLVRATAASTAAAPIVSTPASTPAPPSAPRAVKIKALDKKFQLTHDSPVYENPDNTSRVVGKVTHRKWVHVTGITGDWLQIKLRNGTVGFIPTSAAE
ncbi:MAG: tetratricopeptide repeat protein [Candidatus Binataceae bacterium]